MYIPEAFRETRLEVLQSLIRQHSFGILVSNPSGGLVANHLPFLLDDKRGPYGTLIGHMARANPQWQDFQDDTEVLTIFTGPHAYISPSWYTTPHTVPTWNYVTVHAYGFPRLVDDRTDLSAIMETMVRTYEAPMSQPWALPPDDWVGRLMNAIVGFEIRITRLEGKLKLSQNRSMADQRGVVTALAQQHDPQGREVADLMNGLISPTPSMRASADLPTTGD